MTLDPYPDLPGAELLLPGGRAELDEADARLLDALSRREPPVVTAVEDQLDTGWAARDDRSAPLPPLTGRGPLTPVFREPTG